MEIYFWDGCLMEICAWFILSNSNWLLSHFKFKLWRVHSSTRPSPWSKSTNPPEVPLSLSRISTHHTGYELLQGYRRTHCGCQCCRIVQNWQVIPAQQGSAKQEQRVRSGAYHQPMHQGTLVLGVAYQGDFKWWVTCQHHRDWHWGHRSSRLGCNPRHQDLHTGHLDFKLFHLQFSGIDRWICNSKSESNCQLDQTHSAQIIGTWWRWCGSWWSVDVLPFLLLGG